MDEGVKIIDASFKENDSRIGGEKQSKKNGKNGIHFSDVFFPTITTHTVDVIIFPHILIKDWAVILVVARSVFTMPTVPASLFHT